MRIIVQKCNDCIDDNKLWELDVGMSLDDG